MKPLSKSKTILKLWISLDSKQELALGPGRIELLRHIQESKSLNKAASLMKISYMRAWKLVGEMNRSFASPLINLGRGGKNGGTTCITPLGLQLLYFYDETLKDCEKQVDIRWKKLSRSLKT